MAHVADHLSVGELEERYRTCTDACSARHYQTIWLLAQGHTIEETAETTCFVPRWIEELLARYNAIGPQALGDLRRHNGAPPSVLKPELLAKLRARLNEPPPDGGLWTSGKVAHWMAGELGLAKVRAQRGWEALKAIGWSIQSPRPRNPQAASSEEEAAYKKTHRRGCRRSRQASRQVHRGVGHGRASAGFEADPSPGLGADRRAADRARSPSLRMALRNRFRRADERRDGVVSLQRNRQAVLCQTARRLRATDRGWPRSHHCPATRQCRLARPGKPSRSRWHQARLSATTQPPTPAGRAPMASRRRAARQQALCNH